MTNKQLQRWATIPLTDKGTLARAESFGIFENNIMSDGGKIYNWTGSFWKRYDSFQCMTSLVYKVSEYVLREMPIGLRRLLDEKADEAGINIDDNLTMSPFNQVWNNLPSEQDKRLFKQKYGRLVNKYDVYFSRLQSNTGINDLTRLFMRDARAQEVEEENFNSKRGYINLTDGIYHVHTGKVIPHDPAFLFTNTLPYSSEDIPKLHDLDVGQTFDHFVNHAPKFAGVLANLADRGEDLIERDKLVLYLLAIIGIALSGENKDRLVPILRGETGTGKGLYHAVISKMIPEAYVEVPAGTFIQGGSVSTSAKESSMARLRGKLFCATSEFPANVKLAMDSIKALSGYDPLTGRWMRGNAFTFKFWGLYMARTNQMPHLGEYDPAVRERIRIIEVYKTVAKADRIFRYEDIIADEEGAVILGVAIRLMVAYNAREFQEPLSVTQATDEVFASDNRVGNIARRYLQIAGHSVIRSGELARLLKFLMKQDEEGGHEKLTSAILEQHIKSAFGNDVEVGKKQKGYPVIKGLRLNIEMIEASMDYDQLMVEMDNSKIVKDYWPDSILPVSPNMFGRK